MKTQNSSTLVAGWLWARMAHFFVVALLATAISFVVLDVLPGSAIDHLLTAETSAADIQELMNEAGLSDSVIVRYGRWLSGVVKGDLGKSSVTGQSVSEIIRERAPVTLGLVLVSQAFALAFSVAFAVAITALRKRQARSVASAALLTVLAIPHFVWAVLLISGIAASVAFIPTSGYVALGESPGGWLASIVLPSLTLALIEIPVLGRLLMEELRTQQERPFAEYSRSLGYSEIYILTRQCLPTALVPAITVFAMNLGSLLSGAVIVETIFAVPGIGRAIFTAIAQKDYLLVQGCVLVVVAVYVAANLVAGAYSGRVAAGEGVGK